MTTPNEIPRVYINWERVRPSTWHGWVAAIAIVALAVAAFALIAIIASTLFLVALTVGLIAVGSWFVGNLLRWPRRRRDVVPYRDNYDA